MENGRKSENHKIKTNLEKQKKSRNRMKASAIISVIAVILVIVKICLGIFVFVVESEDNIIVEGNLRYSTSQVIAASGIAVGDSLFRFRGYSKVEKQIEQMLPYIRDVHIQPQLAHTITITVEEQEATFCLWTAELNYCLLDNDGKLLETGLIEKPEIPVILGLSSNSETGYSAIKDEEMLQWEAVQKTHEYISSYEIEGINIYDLRQYPNITMHYLGDGGEKYEIRFGKVEKMDRKMSMLSEAIKREKSTRMTGLIDFVSREGMAIVGDLTHETIPQTVTDVDGNLITETQTDVGEG